MKKIANFFKTLWNGICAAVDKIADGASLLEIFETVAAVITNYTLVPLVSTIGGIGNVFINCITSLMDLLKKSTTSLFAPNIGIYADSPSIFELAISGLDWLFPLMRILAFVLLAFFFLTNIVKILVSPNGGAETPIRLTVNTLVAGVSIYYAPTIIIFVEGKIITPFYSFFLDWSKCNELNFSNFATTAQNYIQKDGAALAEFGTQIAALLSTVVLCIALLIICVQFFKYLLEVSQRYVILGVLIITAPIAVTLSVSNSTRRSFTAWIRMVASQFLLMIINVLFMSVFFKSMASFQYDFYKVIRLDTSKSGLTAIIVWCLLMYSFLFLGTRIDSYLRTLGLSVAETGSATAATFLADLIDMGAIFTGGSSKHKSVRAQRSAQSVRSQQTAEKRPRQRDERILRTDSRNLYTASSINSFVKHAKKGVSESGRKIGSSVRANITGISSRTMSKLDIKTCQVQNGTITMRTPFDEKGRFMAVSFIHSSVVTAQNLPTNHGRWVKIGDDSYLAVAQGNGAERFLTHNPALTNFLNEQYNGRAEEIRDKKGRHTGAYRILPNDKSVNIEKTVDSATEKLASQAYESGMATIGDATVYMDDLSYQIYLRRDGQPQGEITQLHLSGELLSHIAAAENKQTGNDVPSLSEYLANHAKDVDASIAFIQGLGQRPDGTMTATELKNAAVAIDQLNSIIKESESGWSLAYAPANKADAPEPKPFDDVKTMIMDELRDDISVEVRKRVVEHLEGERAVAASMGAQNIEEWVPVNTHTPDIGLNARMESKGGLDYWHYSVPRAINKQGFLTTVCDEPTIPNEPEQWPAWLESQFPSLAQEAYKVVGQDSNGILHLERSVDGKVQAVQCAPVSRYYVAPETAQTHAAELVHAGNDTRYLLVAEQGEDGSHLFRARQENGPLAQKIKRDYTPFEPYLPQANSLPYEASKRRKRKNA